MYVMNKLLFLKKHFNQYFLQPKIYLVEFIASYALTNLCLLAAGLSLNVQTFASSLIISLLYVTRLSFSKKEVSFDSNLNNSFELASLPIFSVMDNKIIYTNNNFLKILGLESKFFSTNTLNFDDVFINIEANKNSPTHILELKSNNIKYKYLSLPLNNNKYFFLIEDNNILNDNMIKNVMELSSSAQLILNKNGIVEFSNSSFKQLINLPNVNSPNWSLKDILVESEHEKLNNLVSQAEFNEQYCQEFKTINENNFIIKITLKKIKVNLEPIFIVSVNDITEHKTLEMHFAHAQKIQTMGHLAGGITHDFNNLLTAMLGFCDLLLMRHLPGDHSFSDIMQIKQNTNRAINLVRQLLSFSKKQSHTLSTLDINESLGELSNLITRLIGEKIELNFIKDKNLENVYFDQSHFDQIIINLAVNARDAMINGGNLTIKTYNLNIKKDEDILDNFYSPTKITKISPGQYVVIEISDTGTGIEHNILKKIFEPFFTTKAINEGTGLGLATVLQLIKQAQGIVLVDSKVGQGTKFLIYLQAWLEAKPIAKNTSIDRILNIGEYTVSDLGGDGTILVVEDEAPVRIFSVHALKNKGYNVLEADCAETALRLIEQRNGEIDLIITDVIMPGMNGPDLIVEVHKKYPSIQVVFMSGYAEDAFRKHTHFADKEFNFLSKPFTLKQLTSKVKELLAIELVD